MKMNRNLPAQVPNVLKTFLLSREARGDPEPWSRTWIRQLVMVAAPSCAWEWALRSGFACSGGSCLGDTPNPVKGLRPLYSGFPNFHELTGVAKPHALLAKTG